MADAAAADDDPYLTLGRALVTGGAPPAAAANDDPYLAAGRAIIGQAAAAGQRVPVDLTAPTDPAAGQNITGIPLLDNIMAGEAQGARDVVATGAQAAKWVNDRVPILAAIDRATGLDPGAAADKLAAERAQFEASPAGQSYAASGGKMVGGGLMAGALLGPVGSAAGAGIRVLGEAAPGLVGRAITGAGNLLSGSAAVPEAGVVPNLLTQATSRSLQGGAIGAGYGALTSGGSDASLSDDILTGTKVGMVLGPVGGAVGDAVPAAWRGAVNYLTPRGVVNDVNTAMAEARARSGPWEPQGPSTGAAAPQSGGAAVTPTAAAAKTPAEIASGRVAMVDDMIAKQANLGRSDFTEYVPGPNGMPGNMPTQAEGLGDARLASIQRQIEPGDQDYANLRRGANENRLDYYDSHAGNTDTLRDLETNLQNADRATLGPIWQRQQPVDAQPVATYLQQRLNSAAGKLGPVRSALSNVLDTLQKGDGSGLEELPEMLYGARRNISFLMSRAGRAANPAYADADVMRELGAAKTELDRAIEPGAPGYQDWLAAHSAAEQEITRQDFLQNARKTLTGADGNIQLSRVNSLLKSVRDGLNSDNLHPAQSLTNGDLEMLGNLKSDLLRENNKSLTMPIGSPTAHNLDIGTELGVNAATAGAHMLASHVPGGNLLVDATAGRIATRNAAAAKAAWKKNLLAPPPTP